MARPFFLTIVSLVDDFDVNEEIDIVCVEVISRGEAVSSLCPGAQAGGFDCGRSIEPHGIVHFHNALDLFGRKRHCLIVPRIGIQFEQIWQFWLLRGLGTGFLQALRQGRQDVIHLRTLLWRCF